MENLLALGIVAVPLAVGAVLGIKWPRAALLGGSLLLLVLGCLKEPPHPLLRGVFDARFQWILIALGGCGTVAGIAALVRPPRSPEEEEAAAAAAAASPSAPPAAPTGAAPGAPAGAGTPGAPPKVG
ncbi:MAG: hypothetical protein HZA54_14620 [Planctomycetes bacterium]|nr:hypothetical protein [Planctomycetota bacterium]